MENINPTFLDEQRSLSEYMNYQYPEDPEFQEIRLRTQELAGHKIHSGLAHDLSISSEPDQLEELSPISALLGKINTLKALVERVERPQASFQETEILEVLFDFGLFVQDLGQNSTRNPEVFEDPLQQVDSLGNVLMKHKKISQTTSEFFSLLGQKILDLAHEGTLFHKHEERSDQMLKETYLTDTDDIQAEETAVAKWKIGLLRREGKRQALETRRLRRKLKRTQNSLSKFANLAYHSQWCPSCGKIIERQRSNSEHFTCVENGNAHLNCTKVVETAQNHTSKNHVDKDGNFSTISSWLNFDGE